MAGTFFKQIIRFFLRSIFIVLILLVFDHGIGKILKFFYFRQESGALYRTTYAIDSTNAEILIFESSHASRCYVSEIFEDSLHYNCYNTGRDGSFILYNYAIFKAVSTRYNPRMIIIDISPEYLAYNTTDYDRLSLLLPYYQTHPEISRIVNLRGPFEKIKLISAIYPYNSLILHIVLGNLNFNKEREPEIKGYVPLFKIMKNEKIDTSRIVACTIDKNKICALKDIISTCKQKKIDLFFVYSPRWSIIQGSFNNTLISSMCSENGIRYIDMSNNQIFINNHDYFADKDHLNDEGAKVFSSMLINKIIRTK